MMEIAVRAEGLEAPGFTAPFYTWEVAGKPVSVAIPLAMIDRLEREAVESFRSLSSRGSEIGGVLLGIVEQGNSTVTLVSYEMVTCDYSRGPLYRLSEAEEARFDRAIAQGTAPGLAAVGFFRSHTRRGVSLDADDRKLLDLRFANPNCLALLIRPYAARPSTCGIFIWENGEIQMEASHLEFPFHSAELAKSARPVAVPAPRAQIVPIASRRVAVNTEPPAAQAAPIPAAAPVEIPIVEPAPRTTAPAVPSAPAASPAPAEPQNRRSRLPVYISGLVAATAVGVFTYIGMQRSNSGGPLARPSTLALRVERVAGELLLTWNRDSEAIRNATRVVLEISDGAKREIVELDLAQLRNGSIVYSPATADVVFKMEAAGRDGAQIASESVRVLSTRPSHLAPAATAPQKPVAAPASDAPEPEEPAETVALQRPTRPFSADSLSERLRPATSVDLPDAPTAARSNAPAPSMPAFAQTAVAPPPAKVDPPRVPAEQPAARGGQIVQARLIQRVDPAYPKIARDAGAKGAVKLSATIGVDGRVKAVKALSGHPLLIRAATDAVMKWVYQPTTLNGSPVETQSEIVLNFAYER